MVGAIVLSVAALLGVRYGMQRGLQGLATAAANDPASQCLSLSGSTTAEESGSTYILGSFRNNCDRKFGQVTISFKRDRSSGIATEMSPGLPGAKPDRSSRPAIEMPEATILAYARDVQPGETRRFKSFSRISKSATFRFDKISGF